MRVEDVLRQDGKYLYEGLLVLFLDALFCQEENVDDDLAKVKDCHEDAKLRMSHQRVLPGVIRENIVVKPRYIIQRGEDVIAKNHSRGLTDDQESRSFGLGLLGEH